MDDTLRLVWWLGDDRRTSPDAPSEAVSGGDAGRLGPGVEVWGVRGALLRRAGPSSVATRDPELRIL
jgi:hypothetical protein